MSLDGAARGPACMTKNSLALQMSLLDNAVIQHWAVEMSLLTEILAVMLVWLSSLALSQLGVSLDEKDRAKASAVRAVPRSPPPVSPPAVSPDPPAVDATR
jgi:hypothetical protein